MSEAAAGRPGTAQPYADILLNVGKPSLSADTDMPVVDLAKPGQGEISDEGGAGIDAGQSGSDTSQTSGDTSGGEADGQPNKGAGEEKDQTSPQQRAAFARERNKRQAAEQRAAALESQISKLTEAVSKLVGDSDKPKDDPRPTRDAFDNPDAYEKALEGWVERQVTTKVRTETQAEQTRQQQERQRQSQLDTYKSREATFEADHPDYQEVVYSDDVQITPVMTQAILEAEDGPAIAYHLGQNPEVAERIAGLTPAQQVYEIGRISVKLAAPPPKPKPEPIRPLNARNAAGPKSPSEMTMEEYAAYRQSKST